MADNGLAKVEYRDDPPVCIFGDSESAIARMRWAAEAVGCRIAGRPSPSGRDCVPAAVALIELDGGAEAAAIALLDWGQSEAARGRPVLVSSPREMIDLVAARLPGSFAQLAGADDGERAEAVLRAVRPAPPWLHDINRDEGPAILQQLTQDVGRIAALLAALQEEEGARPQEELAADNPRVDAGFVRSIIRARRMREQYIRGGLFADPAWDMLLDLMAARLEDRRVAVSSLCIAAAVPATTALRWIKMLTERGLFLRTDDPEDGRRVYIELSDDIARSLTAYLTALKRKAHTAI